MEWYRLKVVGVKDKVIRDLMERLERYEDIFSLHKSQLRRYFNLEEETIISIYDSRKVNLKENLKELNENGVNIVSLKDKNYPEQLRHISQPPVFLYYKGDLSLAYGERLVGVVGTRAATKYGENCCERIVDELIMAGVTTVSGLALGIDGVCHKRTLQKKGKTIAVVGSGLDVIYPFRNRELWLEIEKKGLIISEFPLGTPPIPQNFPQRNRIIVGLSKGIAVIESKKRGGSLITAYLALEEGRDVYAVPGDIFSPSSIGTNELIKNSGAKLISTGRDILEEYLWDKDVGAGISKKTVMGKEERVIYEILSIEKSLDEIILESKLPAGNILAILMEMEIKGIVSSIPGGKYRRKIIE